MRFSTVFTIAGLVGLATAIDYRLLFQVPDGETTTTFQPLFEEACQTWPDAASLTYSNVFYLPGDWTGKNTDTQVRLICAYHDDTGKTVTFTKEVATSLGATEVLG